MNRSKRSTILNRNNGIVSALLFLVLLMGAYFRFVGQNWDDFTHLHPDERFLTLNLLPLIGGDSEFTEDNLNFPPRAILVRSGESRFTTRGELEFAPDYRVGSVEGELSGEFAIWFVGPGRSITYENPEAALGGLISGEVDAIVVPEASSSQFINNARLLTSIGSREIQRIRCAFLYPDSGGVGGYFDARCSPFNPNNAGAGFYTYGTLPLFMAHFASQFTQQVVGAEHFQGGHLVWRALSTIFDLGTIFLIFALGAYSHNRWVGLGAATLYAASALAIQKAHFGTVNSITHFAVMVALIAAVIVQRRGWFWAYGLFGIAAGAAVASRINTVPIVGMILVAAVIHALPALDSELSWHERRRLLFRNFIGLALSGFTAFIAFRVFNPYAFIGPGLSGIFPLNNRWIENIASGSHGVSGHSDIPPNWQWLARPAYIYPLKDMWLWGMGIAFGITAWSGWLWSGYRILRGRINATRNLILFVWILGYFGYMGRLWVMTMRYYLPLYGALAILGAFALYEMARFARTHRSDMLFARVLLSAFGLIFGAIALYELINDALSANGVAAGLLAAALLFVALAPFFHRRRALILSGFVLSFTILWGLMFTNIYRHQLTRVQASRWIWENAPGDFTMRVEGADEDAPLINIAVPNGYSAAGDDPLLRQASVYTQGSPVTINFTVPADGMITTVYAPHLADPQDDPEPETLSISIVNPSGETIAGATIRDNFAREQHVLGDAYEIALDAPLRVIQGERYTVRIEALEGGPIVSAGSVVVVEGDWDDRITTTTVCQFPTGVTLADDIPPGFMSAQECNGRQSWRDLVISYDQIMSYPVDNHLKRENILESLEVGDYIAISSNRFYDTLTRNRSRWPMSTRYYEALFAGELGYDLVVVFQQTFELGPLRVSDQHLPIYDSPDWLNEFEADEAFHVYDHPVVYIFQKADDYSYEKARLILESVPLIPADQVASGHLNSELVGVIYAPTIEVDAFPTALQLTPEIREIQLEGGTWADRFHSDSLINTNQALGALVWWVVILIFGWVAWPLLFGLFPAMADRGYGFAKFAGLLIVGWFLWFIGSLKIPLWSQGGVLLSVLILAGISAIFVGRRREEFFAYLRENRKRLLWIELITFAAFLIFLFVRATNPDLWHFAKGGEKPMDFAYFNAVLRSAVFPPFDPWYAGGFINYYYFGFVLVGSPVLLLGLVPSFAYNLIIPTLFALTGIGAFSVAFNIVASWLPHRDIDPHSKQKRSRHSGNPWVAGMAALILCVALGNLDTIRVFVNGVAMAGGYETPQGIEHWLTQQYIETEGLNPSPELVAEFSQRAGANSLGDRIGYELHHSISLVTSLFRGIGAVLNGQPLPIGSDRWYWGPSRVLAETPGVGGNAITEMPYFTFLYGDLHAHMIDMPMLLFVMLFLFNEFALARRDQRNRLESFLALALGALTVGLIRATNTWDWPSFLLFSTIALTYIWRARWKTISRQSIIHFFWYVIGFVGMSFVFVAPYATWYAAIYNSASLWDGGKTPLWAYFDIHGVFLFLIGSLLVWETARWLRLVRVERLRGEFNRFVIGAGIAGFILLVALVTAAFDYQVALIVIPLLGWIAVLFFRPGQSRAMQYALALAGLALAMTLGVEVIVIDGDIGRQNTVFKFYMQAWLLFSVAGGAAFAWLTQDSENWSDRAKFLWYGPAVVLLILAGLFPIMATRGRAADRMSFETPLTLDGMEFMKYAQHYETNVMNQTGDLIELKDDYGIIRWLQENVKGTPVIMEGRRFPSEYQWNGRISIYTGLPSVVGWSFHQRQQRTFDPLPRLVDQRAANVMAFYNTPNIREAVDILRYYEVEYVIVSGLERVQSAPEGLEKFDLMVERGLLDVAYQEGDGTIYRVDRTVLDQYVMNQG